MEAPPRLFCASFLRLCGWRVSTQGWLGCFGPGYGISNCQANDEAEVVYKHAEATQEEQLPWHDVEN
eukprot:6226383-Amphidinium_carterae.1